MARFPGKLIKVAKYGVKHYQVGKSVVAIHHMPHWEKHEYNLRLLSTPPKYRNQGHGNKAMEKVGKWADANKHTVYLSVAGDHKSNSLSSPQLKKFYTKHGFKVIPGSGSKEQPEMQRKPK